ncbi:MAG: hypothetical protein O3B01_00065 [Planctomycetota bacterium]|nr:hypothetical protein [Planctomycetota bacterium]
MTRHLGGHLLGFAPLITIVATGYLCPAGLHLSAVGLALATLLSLGARFIGTRQSYTH